ncbi:MAG TPA: response regulator [Bacteroidota bacterium]|nr:response regulator [Bacteroidota bacterium]
MKHILLVEDEEQLIDIVAIVLEEEGYDVRKSLTAEEALQQVPLYHPDLIISDMKMGQMDGFTLFQKVRSDSAVGKVPFIFLTGLDDTTSKQKAMALGARAYVIKPFDVDEFVRLVKTVLVTASA